MSATIRSLLALAAFCLIVYGLWLLHPAAALIGTGMSIIGWLIVAHIKAD
jgi:hypothetical protein